MAEEHAARKKKAHWSENRQARTKPSQPLCMHMTYPSRNYQTIVSIAIHGFVVVIDSFDDDDEDTTEADVVRMLQLPAGAVGIGINNERLGSTTRVPICRRKA